MKHGAHYFLLNRALTHVKIVNKSATKRTPSISTPNDSHIRAQPLSASDRYNNLQGLQYV